MNDLAVQELVKNVAVLNSHVAELRKELAQKREKVFDSLFAPEHAEHFRKIAEYLSKSSLVPKQYIGKPADIFVAMAMGYQLGLPIEQAIQDIAVINGKPCLYGDGMLALVLNHPECIDVIEEPIYTGETLSGFKCTVKRKNRADKTRCYTLEDAKKAKLLGKPGVWTDHTARMLQMRARAFALRDTFADALKGLKCVEEVQDYIEAEYAVIDTSAPSRTEMLKKDILTKKGETNEINQDLSSQDSDQYAEAQTIENSKSVELGETGAQENETHHSSSENRRLSDKQLKDIYTFIEGKQISEDRIQKALKYYECESIESMTPEIADHFITQLRKA